MVHKETNLIAWTNWDKIDWREMWRGWWERVSGKEGPWVRAWELQEKTQVNINRAIYWTWTGQEKFMRGAKRLVDRAIHGASDKELLRLEKELFDFYWIKVAPIKFTQWQLSLLAELFEAWEDESSFLVKVVMNSSNITSYQLSLLRWVIQAEEFDNHILIYKIMTNTKISEEEKMFLLSLATQNFEN